MKFVRKAFFWSHLVVGIISGLVVINLSATGALLAFRSQFINWYETSDIHIESAIGDLELPPEALLERIFQQSGEVPTALEYIDVHHPVVAKLAERGKLLYVHPVTGRIIGRSNSSVRGFFSTVLRLHRFLGLSGEARGWGKAITGGCTALFLFLCISGLVCWLPNKVNLKTLRNAMSLRWLSSLRAKCFNWHTVGGFWIVLPTMAVLATGVLISYPALSSSVEGWLGSEAVQVPQSRNNSLVQHPDSLEELKAQIAGLDMLTDIARSSLACNKRLVVNVPRSSGVPVTFVRDDGNGNQPQWQTTLMLARDGRVMSYTPFAQEKLNKRFRLLVRFTHTGELGGLWGQILAFLVTLTSILLVFTGYYLWLYRVRQWYKRNYPKKGLDSAKGIA